MYIVDDDRDFKSFPMIFDKWFLGHLPNMMLDTT